MLKHKLMRAEPEDMGKLMSIANKYAMADSAMQKTIRLDAAGKMTTHEVARKGAAGPSNEVNPSGRNQ